LLVIADTQAHSNGIFNGLEGYHFGVVDEVGAVFLGDASESMNKVFGGADAGGGDLQGRVALNVRLDGANVRCINDLEAFDTVALSLFLQGVQFLLFGSILCDDKLSRGAAGHIMLGAKFLGEAVALDAKARL
jgi:hypothetical protein